MTTIFRSFFFMTALFLILFLPKGLAAEGDGTDQLQSQLDEIKTHLDDVEKQQKDISDKDDKILEELDRLRVWVHRK